MFNFKLMIRCIKKIKCLSIRIKQKLMDIMYTIPTKMGMFAEICYLSTLVFFLSEFVRQDILEITALISVNVRLQDVCVYSHVTVQFAIIL